VASGTRLTTDLVNDIINRTEYAADLLRQYKLVAGTEMYVEPHFDGTRVSYFQPVGGGVNPFVPPQPLDVKYRIIEHTTALTLVNGGPSFLNGVIKLQRYKGETRTFPSDSGPIVPLSWVTPENYSLSFSNVTDAFGNFDMSVNGEIMNYQRFSNFLASIDPSTIGSYGAVLKKGASAVSFLDASIDYTLSPSLVLSSFSFPVDNPSARFSFSYSAFPLVDFYPVTMELNLSRNGFTTESFTINSPSNFLSTGTYTTNRTFDTTFPFNEQPLTFWASVYFARFPIFPLVRDINPN
jgi:hypothetical protein